MGKHATLAFEPDFISPPGDTLEDVLEERGMSQIELAGRMGRTPKLINEIVKGKARITPETALQLERVLDIPASFWSARESRYREVLARNEERNRLEVHLAWLKSIPVTAMTKKGWIKKHKDAVDQLREVLSFFGVASPEQWRTVWMTADNKAAFRKSLRFASDPGAVSAWLRYGEVQAQQRRWEPYDEALFLRTLRNIRGLTTEEPDVFVPAMVEQAGLAGVAVVLTPQLPKARISGATRWLSPTHALIQLSLRYKTDDHFWFTFFHEAAHILLHGKRDVFLEGSDAEQERHKEEEANAWASEFLVPQGRLDAFIAGGEFTHQAVENFAREVAIAPGIIVGQLQHRKAIPFSHLNALKRRFEWKQEGL